MSQSSKKKKKEPRTLEDIVTELDLMWMGFLTYPFIRPWLIAELKKRKSKNVPEP